MKGKEGKGRKKGKPCIKCHKSVIFHVVVGRNPWCNLKRNLGSLVHMVNVINSAKFDHCSFNGLNLGEGLNLPFSCA
jgi:hypothetical protein